MFEVLLCTWLVISIPLQGLKPRSPPSGKSITIIFAFLTEDVQVLSLFSTHMSVDKSIVRNITGRK